MKWQHDYFVVVFVTSLLLCDFLDFGLYYVLNIMHWWWTIQGQLCVADLHKWRIPSLGKCLCSQPQTLNDIVESCPLMRPADDCLIQLRSVLSYEQFLQVLIRPVRLSCLVLSCPCSRCELNWRQVKTVCDWKFWNSFVQSRNAVWTESCIVLKCVHVQSCLVRIRSVN